MPSLSDLDLEQERVYLKAPLDGVIMVKGPPGSGKTIMAYYRADILAEKATQVVIMMYNVVLSRFVSSTENGDGAQFREHVKIKTRDKWIFGWWRSAYGCWPPQEQVQGFRPVLWGEVAKTVYQESSASKLAKLHWGHMVIDEGQDFGKEFYEALNMIRLRNWNGDAPGITIFADDNQQIDVHNNSTTRELIDALGLRGDEDRCFGLSKNYRNTLEIGNIAKYYRIFKMRAEDSDRHGELPEVRLLGTRNEAIESIARLIKRNKGKEIGIVVPNNKSMVRKYHTALKKILEPNGFTVQAYNSRSKVLTVDKLEFDKGSTVTILNMASVKGLEFDVVFAVEMQSFDVSDDRLEAACKNLYVVCSRARENLYMCFTLDEDESDYIGTVPPSLGLIPAESDGLCRYLPKERWAKLSGSVKMLKVPRHVE